MIPARPVRHRAPGLTLIFTLITAVSLGPPPCSASPVDLETSYKGYIQESIGGRTVQIDELVFHRQLINLEVEARSADWVMLRFAVDVLRDDADFQSEDRIQSRLREAYARLRFDKVDLRVGRMQIAWGEADGTIVSDQISPFDLTHFIVPKFDEIRLGVDGATLDYYFDNGDDLQLIWLGRFQEPDFPELDSPWSFVDPSMIPAGFSLAATDRPANTLDNSEFGLRYSGHPLIADWSVGYFRSWDDRPALRVDPSALSVTPTHKRFDLFTFNAVHPHGALLLRFDAAYENGRLLSTDPTQPTALPTASQGFLSREDVLRTIVAVDIKPDLWWWEQADASLQFVNEQVVHPHPALAVSKQTRYIGVRLSAAYLNETVKPWIFSMVNLDGADAWLQAKVDYEPWDDWRFSVEYDAFFGHGFDLTNRSGGVFGGFDDNDMVLISVRRSF